MEDITIEHMVNFNVRFKIKIVTFCVCYLLLILTMHSVILLLILDPLSKTLTYKSLHEALLYIKLCYGIDIHYNEFSLLVLSKRLFKFFLSIKK